MESSNRIASEQHSIPDFLADQVNDIGTVCARYVARHLGERTYRNDNSPEQTASFLAISRCECLLECGRARLSGRLSADDLMLLLDVSLDDFHDPDAALNLATSLAEHYAWETMDDVPPKHRALVKTLQELSEVESFALADALERLWHVVLPSSPVKPEEFGNAVGLVLRT